MSDVGQRLATRREKSSWTPKNYPPANEKVLTCMLSIKEISMYPDFLTPNESGLQSVSQPGN